MAKVKEIISTAQGFKYSINLKYDINDLSKIENYIPTDKSMEILEAILAGFNVDEASRAHILLGSYGTGKSHLAMVLASLLSSELNYQHYQNLIYQIASHNEVLANKIKEIISRKYLIVLPEEGLFDFEQSIILGLKKSLAQAGLADYLPKTFYDLIIDKINNWQKDFFDTYQNLKEKLKSEYQITLKDFIAGIKNYNNHYYQIFLKLYPRLTAGSQFTPYNRVRVTDLLADIEHHLLDKGYKGILFIFDEFGKFLEENIDNFNIKDIQDLAEYCNAEEKELKSSLLLITHKNLAQYARGKENVSYEWRKVAGRFKRHNFTKHSKQIYELISKVIIKSNGEWEKFKEENSLQFEEIYFNLNESPLFPDLNDDRLKRWILFGCYPLHPATTFALFNLAKLIAQNERTLFTFLSHEEEYSLNHFLSLNEEEFPLVSLAQLYDYFLDLIKKEDDNSRIYGVWKKAHRSLQALAKEDVLAKKFIKALAVINIISDFEHLAPTPQMIRDNLAINKKEFKKLESELLAKKVIFYRKSLNHYKFFAGSDLNIKAKMEEVIKSRHNYFDSLAKLNQEYLLAPILAHRYNFEYHMLRFFTTEYLDLEGLKESDLRLSIENNHLDGKIFIFLASQAREIKLAKKKVKDINCEQSIIIILNQELNFEKLLREIDSLEYLLMQKDLLESDPIIKSELEAYLEEREEELTMQLNKVYDPAYQSSEFYYQGQRIDLKNKRDLFQKVAEICKDVFKDTIRINNEMINRNQITGTMKKVRRDILKKLLAEKIEEELGFSNFTAAHTVVRSVLVNNNILIKEGEEAKIKVPEQVEEGKKVVTNINQFIAAAKKKRVSFAEIYDKLQSKPYGLRKGYIPILLLAYLRKYKNRIIITEKDYDRELGPAIFDEIEAEPINFELGIDLWGADKEEYIVNLEVLFEEYINNELRARNRLKALWEAMKEHYRSLSHYTRNTNNLSKETLAYKKILSREFKNTHNLFFEVFISFFGLNNFSELFKIIANSFKELESSLDDLHQQIKKELLKLNELARQGEKEVNLAFLSWYQNLTVQIKRHHFNWKVNSLFDLLAECEVRSESDFLDQLAKQITGFVTSQWNDTYLKKLKSEIKEIFMEIENHSSKQEGEIELVFSEDGDRKKITFDTEDISDLGAMLFSKVKNDFDNFGHSISEKEKLTIVLELLKEQL